MKKIFFLIVITLLSFQQCTTRTYVDKEQLAQIIESKTFTFEAERVIPTSNESVNAINNNIGAAANVLNVGGDGYYLTMKKDEIKMDLPYFGRSYNYIRNKNIGVHFTSKDFKTKEGFGKKGQKTFSIIPNDIREIQIIYVEIFDNGQTYVSFSFRDRLPISYSGIVKLQDEK